MKKNYSHPTTSVIEVATSQPLAASGPVKVKSGVSPAMKEAFFHSCFGIDTLKGTGGTWSFVEKRVNPDGNNVYSFKVTNLKDPFFKEASVNVFEGNGANFTFYSKVPEWNHPFDVVFMIEKNLIYGEGYTEDVSIRRNKDKINNKEWLEWTIDDIDIKLWWDVDDDRRYELNIWTSFSLFENVKHQIPRDQLLTSDFEEDVVPKEDFLRNFFGVNIYEEPNHNWEYEGMFDGRNKHYIFVNNNLKDKFFKKCKILAFEDGGCNFLWQPIPYDPAIPHQLALIIERTLNGNTSMTLKQCIEKYKVDSATSSFDIEVDDFTISINFGFEQKEITLTLWTKINKNELIKKVREEHPERVIADPNRAHLMSKDDFMHNFFGVDIMNAPDKDWIYIRHEDNENPHHVFALQNIQDEFFDSCVLLALDNGGCMFSWGPSQIVDLEFLKVAARIHQNLLGEEDFNIGESITKYMDCLLQGNTPIEFDYDDFKIRITHDSNEGTYGLTLYSEKIDKTELVRKYFT